MSDTHPIFRTGRKVGRTIYQQVGLKPSDNDVLVGVMDTPELAAKFVDDVNNRSRLTTEGDEQ